MHVGIDPPEELGGSASGQCHCMLRDGQAEYSNMVEFALRVRLVKSSA